MCRCEAWERGGGKKNLSGVEEEVLGASGREEWMTSCGGVDLAVAAAGFSPASHPLASAFWFLSKP